MRPIIYSCNGKPIVFADDQGRQWENTREIAVARLESPIIVPVGREVSVEMVMQAKFDLTLLSEPGAETLPEKKTPEPESPREAAMRRLGGFNHEIEEARRLSEQRVNEDIRMMLDGLRTRQVL